MSPPEISVKAGGEQSLFATCFHADFLLRLFFDPGDGSDMILRIAR
jgi:hypothetical protein